VLSAPYLFLSIVPLSHPFFLFPEITFSDFYLQNSVDLSEIFFCFPCRCCFGLVLVLVLVGVGFELRVLCLQSRCSTVCATPPVLKLSFVSCNKSFSKTLFPLFVCVMTFLQVLELFLQC
jgi:hypothetical protein